MESKLNDSVNFVSRYYRPDAFVPRRRFVVYASWWRRRGVAAALVGCVLAASAAIVYVGMHKTEVVHSPVQPVAEAPVKPLATETKHIEFVDAPLDSVAQRIETVYGVKVEGIGDSDTLRLTLSYDGTAQDLIEAINISLDTHLTITQNK